ncbi:MAG: PilN domain-containing protein [Thermoleophilia bacterium]|nr:PilN domain-containing protein [Thermoleophilia bacterium]
MARRINLVPDSDRARTTTNLAMLGFVAAAIVVLFGIGLGYYLLSNTLNERKDELQSLKTETQALQAQVAALKKYDALAKERKTAEATVEEIYASRTLVSDFLDSLSLVVPENVWLDQLSVQTAESGAEGALGALSLAGSTYSFEDVAQLLVRLRLIPSLERIDLQSAAGADAEGAVKSFSIQADLTPPSEAEALPVSQVEVEGL